MPCLPKSYLFPVLFVLSSLLSYVDSSAQRTMVRNFSSKDGLSQSEIGDIVQDDTGRLFLNTAAPGVDVFDGISFTNIGVDQGLQSPIVDKLFKDSQGRILILSINGFDLLTSDGCNSYPFDLPNVEIEAVYSIAEFRPGAYVIGTDKGIVIYENEKFSWKLIQDHESVRVFGMAMHPEGVMIGTDIGPYLFKNDIVVPIPGVTDFLKETQILSVAVDYEGNHLLGVKQGYYQVEGKDVVFHQLMSNDAYSVISILKRRNGEIYFGTNGEGLFIRSQNGEIEHLKEENGLSDDFIWSIFEDDESDLWLGTSGAGLDLITSDLFTIFTTENGLAADIVYDISEDKEGRKWIGMIEGGISVYDGKKFINYDEEDGISHRSVRSMYQDGDTTWIGTENGLSIYHQGRFENVSEYFKVDEHAIFDIHKDENGVMWFACKGERYFGENGGIVRYDGDSSVQYTVADGLGSDNVYCIYERSLEEIWFGSTAGINIWQGSSFTTMQLDTSNSCIGTVLCLEQDSRQNMWIGSITGLNLYRNGEVECIGKEFGLNSTTTYFLETQGDSILWVGSSIGLEKIDLNSFYEKGELNSEFYNDLNGFYGSECNQNAVLTDSEGYLWFGSIKGVMRYDPNKALKKNLPIRMEISNVKLHGKKTDWSRRAEPKLELSSSHREEELNYNENNLLFEFLSVNLTRPNSVKYRFKMDGLESNWSDLSIDRSVYYSNLVPGDYTFKVQAVDRTSGIESEIKSFSFAVVPALWQTRWFKGGVGLVLALGIFSFFYWRIRSIRKHERELQEYNKSMSELEMAALRAQMNPHFLFNSLNSINHFIIKNQKELASDYLTKFSRLVRLVLHNSKEKLVSLEEEMIALRLYIDIEKLRFQKGFEYEEKISSGLDLNNYNIPPLLLQPYAENAIWHGLLHLEERVGKLRVQISEEKGGLLIVIEDNGIGREKSQMLKSKSAMKKKSMGMKLNSDRMRLARELYDQNTREKITDLENEKGEVLGTRVEILMTDGTR